MAVAPGIGEALVDIVGRDNVCLDPNVTRRYACRLSELVHAVPDAVVFPSSTAEVSDLLRGAYACGVPIVPRSAASYGNGAMILHEGGIVLALDRMNRIIDTNAADGLARIQPCVSPTQLQSAAARLGVRYALAANLDGETPERVGASGGGSAVAVAAQCRVLGLEAVLPSGEIARTGGGLLAREVDERQLARLLACPDGTLAVITELTLALDPARAFPYLGLAYFPSVAAACTAAKTVMVSERMPIRLEFLDRQRLRAVENQAHLGLRLDAHALLLFTGADRSAACRDELRRIGRLCADSDALHVAVAEDATWCRTLQDTLGLLNPTRHLPGETSSGEDRLATSVARTTARALTNTRVAAERRQPMFHNGE